MKNKHNHKDDSSCCCCNLTHLTRREFLANKALLTAGVSGAIATQALGTTDISSPLIYKKPLKVLPVFVFNCPTRKEATSWRWSGAFDNEAIANTEKKKITLELNQFKKILVFH